MIRWFKDIQENDFDLVGGKAYKLAEMDKQGIPIPNGFVVTSEAYEAYVSENNLQDLIQGLLISALPIEAQSDAIMKLFTVEKISPTFVEGLMAQFQQLKGSRVAVRSSSTAEDLPGMSFAGQYATFLNVGEEDIIEKIVLCWKSLWNRRAMDYRKKNQVAPGFSHGVVVQTMVDALVSGVVFTANPINGLRRQLVINASWGLGEAIVSGQVNPDQFIVDRDSGQVVERSIHDKTMKVVRGSLGSQEVAITGEESLATSLSVDKIEELRQGAEAIEAYFGSPQDIEFAFDQGGHLHILQSRDITTLYPIDRLVQDGKIRPYLSGGTVLFGMKEPFTNLGFDVMSYMFPTVINVMTNRKKHPLTNNFISYAGNRMFVDMTYLFSNKLVAKQFAKAFSGNDLPLEGVMNKVREDYGQRLSHQGIHFRLPLGFVGYGLSMAGSLRTIMKMPNKDRYQAIRKVGDQWYAKVQEAYKQVHTVEERLDFAREVLVEGFKLSQVQASYCIDANNYIKIDKVLKKHFGNKYKVETLAQSLPGCFTQTMTLKLNHYAKTCSEKGLQPSATDPEFMKILEIYGHRANIELDFGTKRWREDPSYLLDLVASYMVDHMYLRNLEDHTNKRLEAEGMMEEVRASLASKIGRKRAAKFHRYMVNYRYGAAMREYPKSDIVRFMELGRKAVLAIGDDMVSAGLLDNREDVFFLHKEQILEGKDLKTLAASNKAVYKKEMARTTIPRILMNNGHTYYSSTKINSDAKVLQGIPLSAGTYEGVIRLVFDPMTTDLKEGEVMVTESTNPAWTPLFATAGALIMTYGGPMSHGGIVAREYGIPAVVGIPSATEALKDGQRVRVNGENGRVELLD